MLETVAGFVEVLRGRGLRVSPGEAIDAVNALGASDLGQRDAVRLGLRLTCAKDRADLAVFDRAFDDFFRAPGRRGRGSRTGLELGVARRAAAEPKARRGTRLEPSSLADRLGPRPGTRLRRVVRAVAVERAGEVTAARPAEPYDVAALSLQARRRLERLRRRLGRRRRPGRRGALSVKRTVRRSLRTGGVPFWQARDVRRPRRVRLVLALDVSYSVTSATRALLALAGDLLDALPRCQLRVFVDRPIDATRALGRAGAGFDAALASLPGLDLAARSDYGRAFYSLLDEPGLVERDTILVVLGDGRSNRLDPQVWAFAELAARARSTIWLVTEAAARWGTGDSALGDYLPHASYAVEAGDADGLVRGLDTIARGTVR